MLKRDVSCPTLSRIGFIFYLNLAPLKNSDTNTRMIAYFDMYSTEREDSVCGRILVITRHLKLGFLSLGNVTRNWRTKREKRAEDETREREREKKPLDQRNTESSLTDASFMF